MVIKTSVLLRISVLISDLQCWTVISGSRGVKSDKEGYKNLINDYEDYKCANYSELPFDNGISGKYNNE